MSHIIIVESKDKVDSVEKYAGDGFLVFASGGHVSDLPEKGELGIDEATLAMDYELTPRGERAISRIRPHLKDAERIILATDPDREGEAIAAALKRELNLGNNYERAKFNEVTKSGVSHAINNTTKINEDLVDAQVARRIIDRLVGWKATPVVSDFTGDDVYPMGRVQSQAVAIIAKRDAMIDNFVAKKHFIIQAEFNGWTADLDVNKSRVGELIDNEYYWLDKEACDEVSKKSKCFEVINFTKSINENYSKVAFKTSTMQQSALNNLGFSAKQTDEIASRLFAKGHVTYIRTDSTVLSNDGYDMIVAYAKAKGLPLADKKRDGTKAVVAQEAHEAIRPTDFNFDGTGLEEDEKKLYDLIFKRAVASQLAPSKHEKTIIDLQCEVDGKIYFYTGENSVLVEKGYLAYFSDDDENDKPSTENNPIDAYSIGDELTANTTQVINKTTRPPNRYNEGSLGNYLEANGIGRPSTYSKIYEKIVEHGYVEKKKNQLICTMKGKIMVEATTGIFSIMQEEFTRTLEAELDDIANGNKRYEDVVFRFMKIFNQELEKFKNKPPIKPRILCEKCQQNPMKRYPSSKQPGRFVWSCTDKSCGHLAWEVDGKVQTIAEREKIKQAVKARKELLAQLDEMATNPDGTPKFPCPACQSKVVRRPYGDKNPEKKGQFFWVCQNDKCGKFFPDNAENISPYLNPREYEIKQATNADGTPKYPCFSCGNVMIKATPKGKPAFYICTNEECKRTYSDENGKPSQKAAWLIAAEARSKNKKGQFKWHCKKCKHPVLMRDKKDKSGTYKKCSNPNCGELYRD